MGRPDRWRLAVALVVALLTGCAADDTGASSAEQIRNLIEERRHEEAETAARVLLERAEADSGPDSPEVATALELLAWTLALRHELQSEGFEERLALAQRALDIRLAESSATDRELAWSYYVVGLVHNLMWDWGQSLEPFERALAIVEAHYGEDHPETEVYLREYGSALFGNQRFREAKGIFQRYLNVAERNPVNGDLLAAHYNLALCFHIDGQLEEAERHLEAAETLLDIHSDTSVRRVVRARSFRGTVLALRGELSEALLVYETTLKQARDRLGHDDLDTIAVEVQMARNLYDLGDYDRARRLLAPRLEAAMPEIDPYLLTVMRYNFACIHHAMGELETSRAWFEKALIEAPGPDGPNWTEMRIAYANVLFDQGNVEAARRQLDDALANIKQSGEQSIHLAEALAESGSFHLEIGEIDRAREELQQALDLIDVVARGHQRFYAIQEELAEALFAAEETEAAFAASTAAARSSSTFDRVTIAMLPQRLALARAMRPRVARDIAMTIALSSSAAAEDWRRDIFDLLTRSRAMTFDEIAKRQRRWIETTNEETRQLLREWQSAGARLAALWMIGPVGNIDHYVDRLEMERREVERLEYVLSLASTDYKELFRRRDAGLDELHSVLEPREALVSYVRYGKKAREGRTRTPYYAAAVLRSDRAAPRWIDLGPAASLEAAIADWRSDLSPSSALASDDAHRKKGETLRRTVWDPLAGDLDEIETVYLVPDGAIHLISFAGLPHADGYLIETAPLIHHITAERDLLRTRSPAARQLAGLLIVGDPAFDTVGDSVSGSEAYRGSPPSCTAFRSRQWTPLPGARDEARAVRGIWTSGAGKDAVTELIGSDATEDAVKREITRHRVVHLATHGFYVGDECHVGDGSLRSIGGMSARLRPGAVEVSDIDHPLLLSGLVLAGANRSPKDGAQTVEDGVLTAEEAVSLDMRGVELAVLSACQTGSGTVTQGEGMFGLRRAFLLAGARSVVTNLWEVDDRSARVWIERFYRQRFIEGDSLAGATRAAGLHVLQTRRQAGLNTHPFFWAGWLATGQL